MKVLHLITGLDVGGAETALYRVLDGGLRKRFDNEVISLSDGGRFAEPIRALGVPVTTLGLCDGRAFGAGMAKLRHAMKTYRPDVVQGWMYHGNLAAWLARIFVGGRVALAWNVRHSLHRIGDEKRSTRRVIRLNRLLSAGPDAIIYNSRVARAQHETFGFRPLHGRVVPNGFDLAGLAPSKDIGARTRATLGIPHDALVIGHVARLHPMKGHEAFLRSAARVAGRCPAVHVVLSGRGVTADDRALTEWVPAELRGRFHFLGERGDVPDLMRAMDVLCQSSCFGEAFPNVLGEAMAAGLPCVATDVGDSASIIGDTGFVVPPRDEGALTAALERVAGMPVAAREALGSAARARMAERYALSTVVKQYVRLYEALGTRGGAG